MLKKFTLSIMALFLFLNSNIGVAVEKKSYVCGLAGGYPPYQFKDEKSETAGFDAEVVRLIFQKAGKEIIFSQMNWSDVIGNLYFSNIFDCVGGMEINEARRKRFDFTSPYYSRRIVVFVRSDNNTINKIEDLIGRKVTGDRDSFLETLLEKKGIRKNIRIKETESKEESMKLLKNGEFEAMIAPKEVGFYLAKKFDVKIRILAEAEIGTPVGIAVKKGNMQLLNMLENALQELIGEGRIYELEKEWFR